METTLLFEHGGSYRASQLWVTRILVVRLFRERLSLSRAVKSYTKFQWSEMMRVLVKLNELEEVSEPPLGGHLKASVGVTQGRSSGYGSGRRNAGGGGGGSPVQPR